MNKIDNLPEHLCTVEAAMYLGVSLRTLHKYVTEKGLKKHKKKGCRPFYLKSEIKEWVKDVDTDIDI